MHFTNNHFSPASEIYVYIYIIYTFSSTLPPKLRMLHSKLFSVTPILTRVWKLGAPSLIRYYIQKALKAQRNRTLMPKSLALFHSFPRNPSVLFALGTVLYPFLCTSLDSKILKWVVLEWFTALIYIEMGAESLNNRAKTPEMSASKGIQKNKWSMSK